MDFVCACIIFVYLYSVRGTNCACTQSSRWWRHTAATTTSSSHPNKMMMNICEGDDAKRTRSWAVNAWDAKRYVPRGAAMLMASTFYGHAIMPMCVVCLRLFACLCVWQYPHSLDTLPRQTSIKSMCSSEFVFFGEMVNNIGSKQRVYNTILAMNANKIIHVWFDGTLKLINSYERIWRQTEDRRCTQERWKPIFRLFIAFWSSFIFVALVVARDNVFIPHTAALLWLVVDYSSVPHVCMLSSAIGWMWHCADNWCIANARGISQLLHSTGRDVTRYLSCYTKYMCFSRIAIMKAKQQQQTTRYMSKCL